MLGALDGRKNNKKFFLSVSSLDQLSDENSILKGILI